MNTVGSDESCKKEGWAMETKNNADAASFRSRK